MSSQTTTPTEFLDEFRTTFHRDFSYDHKQRRENLVIESREGIRFHFPAQLLTDASAFFAGAPVPIPTDHEQPVPGSGRLQAIPLTFASAPALSYLLIAIRQTSSNRRQKTQRLSSMGNARQPPSWEVTIESVRVAEILDAPELARTILKRSGLDLFHRQAIEDALDIPRMDRADIARPAPVGNAPDLSFSLDIDTHYQRCHSLLKGLNPRALDSLTQVHRRRQAAIANVLLAWREPENRLLKKACSTDSKRNHTATCNTRMLSASAVRHQMQVLTPIMMDVLAGAKSRTQRTTKIRAVLSPRFNGCRGCLDDISGVYLPALKIFQEEFPATPDDL